MSNGEIRMLIYQLRSKKIDIRKRAIDQLAKTCDIDNEYLLAALSSTSDRIRRGINEVFEKIDSANRAEVQKNAIGNLGIDDPNAEDALIYSLLSVEPKIKSFAIDALGKIKSIKGIQQLIQILGNQNESDNIRIEIIKALGNAEDKMAEDQLIAALEEEKLRCDAAIALGRIKSTKSVPYLMNLVNIESNENDSVLNDSVIKALCRIKDPQTTKLLIKTLERRASKSNTADIIEALGEIKDPTAIPTLLDIMKHEDVYKSLILEAFGKIGDSTPVKFLVSILEDEDEDDLYLREDALAALGMIGDARAVDPLICVLNNDEEDIDFRILVANTLIDSTWREHVGLFYKKDVQAINAGKSFIKKVNSEKIHNLVSQSEGYKLREEWQITKTVLLDDLDSNEYLLMEKAIIAFMGIGKEEIISVLIEKLDTKGNKTLAEVYLNCGHPELSNAAREWARKRGYTIKMGEGAHPVSWRSWQRH